MADPKIVEYIKSNLSNGVDIDEIERALKASGWPEDQITSAMQETTGETEPVPGPPAPPAEPEVKTASKPVVKSKEDAKPKRSHKKLIIAVVILLVLVALFAYLSIEIVSDFTAMYPEAGGVLPFDFSSLG